MQKSEHSYCVYYDALCALTDTELRRLWLAEGRRRGYEVN